MSMTDTQGCPTRAAQDPLRMPFEIANTHAHTDSETFLVFCMTPHSFGDFLSLCVRGGGAGVFQEGIGSRGSGVCKGGDRGPGAGAVGFWIF